MKKILMPKLGESVVEATLESWFVQPGDKIKQYQSICEVVSDKVNVEIPASDDGVVAELLVQPGATIPIGTPICILNISGKSEAGEVAPITQLKQPEKKQQTVDSPQELVWRHPDDEIVSVDPIRRTIAKKMVASVTTIPHAWAMIEVDVTELVNYRQKVKDEFYYEHGVKITYLPFFIKAVVKALQNHPIMNSSFAETEIIVHKHINISLAVASERALFVPVIHDADEYSISGLAKKITELASKAREGKLTPEEISKGTFTVNNTGSFGSISSKPIITQPQTGMITLEAIGKRPVVQDDEIVIRSMANICLSFDHRVTDGLGAGRFLATISDNLQGNGGLFNEAKQ